MFEDFLDHRCNIYYLVDEQITVGYGINAESVRKENDRPTLKNVACHFHVKNNNQIKVIQNEPYTSVEGDVKLTLPAGVDIRMNDTVEDIRDGLKYRAGKPSLVHNGHHIIVTLQRLEGVNAAI